MDLRVACNESLGGTWTFTLTNIFRSNSNATVDLEEKIDELIDKKREELKRCLSEYREQMNVILSELNRLTNDVDVRRTFLFSLVSMYSQTLYYFPDTKSYDEYGDEHVVHRDVHIRKYVTTQLKESSICESWEDDSWEDTIFNPEPICQAYIAFNNAYRNYCRQYRFAFQRNHRFVTEYEDICDKLEILMKRRDNISLARSIELQSLIMMALGNSSIVSKEFIENVTKSLSFRNKTILNPRYVRVLPEKIVFEKYVVVMSS